MALAKITWSPSRKELRLFALLELIFFAAVAWLAATRFASPTVGWAVLVVAAAIAALGLVAPRAILPVYLAWMAAAFPVGWLVSHAAMAGVFFLVITPMALIMRARGRDPMQRRFDPSAPTYWKERGQPRGTKDYFRQY